MTLGNPQPVLELDAKSLYFCIDAVFQDHDWYTKDNRLVVALGLNHIWVRLGRNQTEKLHNNGQTLRTKRFPNLSK